MNVNRQPAALRVLLDRFAMKQRPDLRINRHGWFSPGHGNFLKPFVQPDALVLEVGSWLGKSARWFATASPGVRVIAVDHWLGSEENVVDPRWQTLLPNLYEQFVVNCWGHRRSIFPIRLDSVSGMRLLAHYKIKPDLVYIDAAHDYLAVRRDIETALELFPRAQLTGDDYNQDGVRQAVAEASGKSRRRLQSSGRCWALIP